MSVENDSFKMTSMINNWLIGDIITCNYFRFFAKKVTHKWQNDQLNRISEVNQQLDENYLFRFRFHSSGVNRPLTSIHTRAKTEICLDVCHFIL